MSQRKIINGKELLETALQMRHRKGLSETVDWLVRQNVSRHFAITLLARTRRS